MAKSDQMLRRMAWALLGVWMLLAPIARGDAMFDQFVGDDGWLDVSDWLLENAHGFMPVPIIITEPAVGEGAGVALVFFHEREEADGAARGAYDGGFSRPSISVGAAAITRNDSWFAGGGHLGIWKNDTIRYTGFAGLADVNMKFFGAEDTVASEGLEFNGKGQALYQALQLRLSDSPWWVGVEHQLVKSEIAFENPDSAARVPGFVSEKTSSKAGLFLVYEDLDSTLTPLAGWRAELHVGRYDDAIGSDSDFWESRAKLHRHFKPHQRLSLGLRGEAWVVDGDRIPFEMLPFIDLRGIPALRYQGEAVGVGEIEGRWAFHRRISLLGFAGAGYAADDPGDLSDAPSRTTQGLGLRYYLANKLGAHTGFDIAEGPEETVFYLTFGSSWN